MVSMRPTAVAEPPGAEPLFTRICSPPSWAAASSIVFSTKARSLTSQANGRTRRPVVVAISPAAEARRSGSRAMIARSTPSRANSMAIALPMPRLPPVTTAHFPCNPKSMDPPADGSA